MSREEHLSEVAEWEEAVCEECGHPFPKRSHYERRCMVCYKDSHDYNLLVGDKAFLWTQIRLHETSLRLQQAEREAEEASKKSEKKPETSSGLRGDLLRQVISLCHPDRHNSSSKATEVTKKLLKLREEQRKRRRRT